MFSEIFFGNFGLLSRSSPVLHLWPVCTALCLHECSRNKPVIHLPPCPGLRPRRHQHLTRRAGIFGSPGDLESKLHSLLTITDKRTKELGSSTCFLQNQKAFVSFYIWMEYRASGNSLGGCISMAQSYRSINNLWRESWDHFCRVQINGTHIHKEWLQRSKLHFLFQFFFFSCRLQVTTLPLLWERKKMRSK